MINEYTIGGAIVLGTIVGIWGWKKLAVVMAGRKVRTENTSEAS